ncbi:LAFE_0H02432g1_1 [Lachancea fermentati]|uniref:Cysteine protease n=1 Tax=Lachancea fermentati TaxID=4955 RepID=A0A1G4MJA1_LACFM|nr:LAFE_0H02432g1_1 [Lachancea fermentati]
MDFLQRVSQTIWELDNDDTYNDLIVLGQTYPSTKTGVESEECDSNTQGVFNQLFHKGSPWNPDFLLDVQSILYFTYRTRFEPIPKDRGGPSPMNFGTLFRDNPLNAIENAINHPDCFCSDIGWGCMIRTGQTLLANALQRVKLGRSYRIHTDEELLDVGELELISWFEDNRRAPFSLHKFVEKGLLLSGKTPGEWFGPSAASRSIQSLVHEYPNSGINHCIISTDSADVYEEDVQPIFENDPNAKVLLLLGVKLGLNNVNEFYWQSIKNILGSKQSVGISGGRPSSSLYFFGFQDDYLFYLDPHTAQLDLSAYASNVEKHRSVHSAKFNKVHLSELDPSMLIGILIQGSKDWDDWKSQVEKSQIIHVWPKRQQEFYMDEDVESLHSTEAKDALIGGDYVEVAPIIQQAGSSKDDEFQDVQCKNQNIVVVGEFDNSATDMEVENVLVEQETVPIQETASF